MQASSNSKLVYSTEGGRTCAACRLALAECSCKSAAAALPQGDGVVRGVVRGVVLVSRQSKGRGGKTVTLVRGLAVDATALAVLGKQLRSACGAGGTVKDGVIEVQGDHRDAVMAALVKLGHRPKQG